MLTAERRRQFEDYLSGTLSDDAAATLEAELLADESLLAAFEALSKRAADAEESADVVPPPDFTHSVRERLRRRSGGRLFQEDRVTSRYIPMFAVAAFAVLLVVALATRFKTVSGADEVEVVEQGDVLPGAQETSPSPIAGGRRVTDREHRADYDPEHAMAPASAGIRYQDLPVSGKPTPTEVTYTKRIMLLESSRSADELRAEIESIFGSRELTDQDGYFRIQLRDRDYAGAMQRLEQMDGVVKEESRRLPLEEMESMYLRFYYDMPASQP